MKKNYLLTIFTLLLAILFCYIPAQADRGDHRDGDRRWKKETRKYDEMDKRGYRLDRRHNHNRYYPKRGETFRQLPRGYRTIRHRHENYYFYSGIWYRFHRDRYVVDFPPVGLTISFLPRYYSTIWVGGLPYYYADGVYYRWLPRDRVYVVSEPPRETEIVEQPEMPDQFFIYPKEGQSEELQADDRYECHRWSADQTGFDPTQFGGNVPDNQYDAKKADYQRAMKACLEGRGYSVQ